MKQSKEQHESRIEQISEANSELDLRDVSNFYWFLIENDKLDAFICSAIHLKRKFMKADFEFFILLALF